MSVRGETNRPPVPATVDDYRHFTDYRSEPCACGGTVYAGGFPVELTQRVAAHNATADHMAYRIRVEAYLYDETLVG